MLCFGENCISAALNSSAFQNLQVNGQFVALQDIRLMLEKLRISFLGRQGREPALNQIGVFGFWFQSHQIVANYYCQVRVFFSVVDCQFV
jgi:hypothetical protein